MSITRVEGMKAGSNPAPSDTGSKHEGSVASTPRAFTAALAEKRCRQDITLRDGSAAQCMRKEAWDGLGLCWQHQKKVRANGCDCQAPNASGGVKQFSMTCPIHNYLEYRPRLTARLTGRPKKPVDFSDVGAQHLNEDVKP